jgi:CIC family chloride channel protein
VFCWTASLFGIELNPLAFCAVGMAAFFASTIQAPLTGILLILEMTACWDLTLPMIAATIFSFTTVKGLGRPSIYTSLRLRIPEVRKLASHGVNVYKD